MVKTWGNQPIIQTQDVLKAYEILQDCLVKSTPQVVVVMGDIGVGKSTVIEYYLENITPSTLAIQVVDTWKLAPLPLMRRIVKALEEKIQGRNLDMVVQNTAKALKRNGVSLLVIEDAGSLPKRSLKRLLEVHVHSGCHLILEGGSDLIDLLNEYKKTYNDLSIKEISLNYLSPDELVNLFLPNVVLPTWRFDPNEEGVLEFWTEIWSKFRPSLWGLMNFLRVCNAIAETEEVDYITQEIVAEALPLVRTNAD